MPGWLGVVVKLVDSVVNGARVAQVCGGVNGVGVFVNSDELLPGSGR